jgi:hypothetical protein
MSGFVEALKQLSEYLGQPERPSDADLADLGLSRVDYDILVTGAPGARARIEAMAAQFGLPPEQIDAERGLALELAQTCAHCGEAATCRKALQQGRPLPAELCPNAPIYRAMLGGDGRS